MNSSDGLVNEAKYITSSLKRVRKQIENDIVQLGDVSGALREDGNVLKDTYDEHAVSLKNALHSTKRRLISVKAAAIMEKYSVISSLLFFTMVVSYIVIKRTRVIMWFWIVLVSSLQGMTPKLDMYGSFVGDSSKSLTRINSHSSCPDVSAVSNEESETTEL